MVTIRSLVIFSANIFIMCALNNKFSLKSTWLELILILILFSVDLYSNYMVYNLFIFIYFFVEYHTHGASTVATVIGDYRKGIEMWLKLKSIKYCFIVILVSILRIILRWVEERLGLDVRIFHFICSSPSLIILKL